MKNLRNLVLVSIILAIVVVTLGAYTRLTHAGLGCPDWPGCYGLIDVPQTAEQIAKAEQAFPERPVEVQKAWNEMIHRYFAGALGLFILAIAVISYRNRHLGTPLFLPMLLLALVIFQAALGMWTVTMKLMPIVVMGHLLGGFTTLCLLFLLYLRLSDYRVPEGDFAVKKYAKFAGAPSSKWLPATATAMSGTGTRVQKWWASFHRCPSSSGARNKACA